MKLLAAAFGVNHRRLAFLLSGLGAAYAGVAGCFVALVYTLAPGQMYAWIGVVFAVVIIGGGSPKNFVLQTEPQIQEVLGLDEKGHDYYLQFTDARVDTGGLSGATPAEAVTWGKVDPDRLPDAVVCYIDSTVALPLLTAYAMAKRKPRQVKGLYHHRDELVAAMKAAAQKTGNLAK